jgi:hypothetical protein
MVGNLSFYFEIYLPCELLVRAKFEFAPFDLVVAAKHSVL